MECIPQLDTIGENSHLAQSRRNSQLDQPIPQTLEDSVDVAQVDISHSVRQGPDSASVLDPGQCPNSPNLRIEESDNEEYETAEDDQNEILWDDHPEPSGKSNMLSLLSLYFGEACYTQSPAGSGSSNSNGSGSGSTSTPAYQASSSSSISSSSLKRGHDGGWDPPGNGKPPSTGNLKESWNAKTPRPRPRQLNCWFRARWPGLFPPCDDGLNSEKVKLYKLCKGSTSFRDFQHLYLYVHNLCCYLLPYTAHLTNAVNTPTRRTSYINVNDVTVYLRMTILVQSMPNQTQHVRYYLPRLSRRPTRT